MHSNDIQGPVKGILYSVKRMALLVGLAGLCCVAHGQSPETLKASADQQLKNANAARNAGRYDSAIEAYSEARELYKTIAQSSPEWKRSDVQKKLFYCRQQISLLEEDQELREGDDLNSILDMIERESGTTPVDEDDSMATLTVSETEIIEVDTSEEDMGDTAEMLEELEMSRLENRRFTSTPTTSQNAEIADLRKQLARTQKVVESLQDENHELTKKTVEMDQLKKEVVALRRRDGSSSGKKVFRKQRAAEPSADDSKEVKALQKKLAAAEQSASKSEEELAALRAELKELKGRKSGDRALEKKLTRAEKEAKALRDEIEELKEDRESQRALKKQLSRNEKSLKQSAKREQELQAEVERLRTLSSQSTSAWDAPVPVEGVKSFRASGASAKETAALEKQVAKLEKANQAAKRQIEELQQDLERAADKSSGSVASSSRADRKRIAGLEKSNRKLGAELKRTRDALDAANRQITSTQAERQTMESAVEKADSKWSRELLEAKQDLNRERTARLELAETVRVLKERLASSEKQHDELLLTMQERAVTSEVTGADMQALEREWKAKYSKALQEASRQKREVAGLSKALDEARGERDRLDARFESLQDEYLQLANSSTVTASENVTLKKQYEYATDEVEKIREENEELQRTSEELVEAEAVIGRLREQLAANETVIERLKQETEDLELVEDRAIETERTVAALRMELAQQSADNEELQSQLHKAAAGLSKMEKLETDVDVKELEIAEWMQKIQELQASNDDLMNEQLDAEVALARIVSERDNALKMEQKIKADYSALAADRDQIAARLESAKRSVGERSKELEQQVRSLQKQLSVRDQQLESAQELEDEVRQLKQQLSVAERSQRDAVKDVQRDLIAQRKKNEQLAGQATDLQGRAAKAEKDVEMLKAAVSQTQKEKEILERRIDDLNKTHHRDLLAAKKDLAKEKDHAAPLQDQISALNKQLEQARNNALAYEKKLLESEKLKDALESEIVESDEAWRQKLAETMKDAQLNEEQLRAATESLEKALAGGESYQRKIEDLTLSMAQQDAQLKELAAEKQELQKQLAAQSNLATRLEAQSDEEVVRMQELVSTLQSQVKDTETLRVALRDKERLLERREREVAQVKEQLEHLEAAKKQWNASNDDIRKQWSEIKTQVDGLNDQLREAQRAKGVLQAKLEQAEAALKSSSGVADDLADERARVRAVQRKLELAEKENASLKGKLDESAETLASLDELREQVAALKAENGRMQKALDAEKQQHAAAGDNTRDLEQQLKAAEDQMLAMRKELENVRKSNALNVKLVERQQEDLKAAEQLGSKMDAVSREKRTLLEQLQKIQKERDTILSEKLKLAGEQQQLNAQVAKQSELISSLKAQVESGQDADKALASAESRWEKQRQALQAEVAGAKAELEKQAQELASTAKTSSEEQSRAADMIRELEKKLGAAEKENRLIEKEKKRLEQVVADVEGREKKLAGKQAEASTEIKAIQREIRALQDSNKTLEKQLAKKEAALAKQQKQLGEVEESSERALAEVREQLAAVADEKDQLAKKMADQQSELEKSAREMQRVTASRASDEKQLEALRSELAANEEEFKKKVAEAEKMSRTVAALEADVSSVKDELKRAESEKDELNVRVKSLTQELKQATDTLESLANY